MLPHPRGRVERERETVAHGKNDPMQSASNELWSCYCLWIHSGLIKDGSKDEYSDGHALKLQAKSGAAFLYFYSDKHYVENGFRIKYR